MNKGIILILICTILTALGQIMWKLGMQEFNIYIIYLNYSLIIGCLLYVAGAFFLTYALKFSDLSKIHPFLSLGYVWVFLIGIIFLGELFTISKLIGIFLIIMGVIFIGSSK
ncbi:EamA family transporter [Candidatus Woesearchaeota archaeon]|nr:EamA family transporter [Candidatus Woesearchaeota archaeon]MBT4387383.1 EamA family transporter [Candidatus Woesearchaeota archaeon]MBT4595521.1 EamA family transporter [Candidatus Woesearchaeota archaeon]MBT5740996.1 EamA family transporter [Candidatus Woesearchaeota archaeon]MBT6505415.1 EamA family transporter [Candidatus Woesearchaeota archaeon]